MPGPLYGVRVLELGGLGPAPFCGMVLGDLGADVIRVDRPGDHGPGRVLHRGRRSVALDLKSPAGAEAARRIAAGCDAVLEGFRPGVAERLGLGPELLRAANHRLVYGRMTGWGQDGPYAHTPGHDINYLALSGALHTLGPAGGDPVVPLNLVADFGGGGMLLALGVVSALLAVRAGGEGQVVDAAMVDGTALLMSMTFGLLSAGQWVDRRGSNLLDGAAPFYRVYRCSDGRHVAVGSLEPPFYAELLRVLGLADDPGFAAQFDTRRWPAMCERLEKVFAGRPRDEWAALFEGTQACVTPVLSMREAVEHPHNAARGTFATDAAGAVRPAPAPRFSLTPTGAAGTVPVLGEHTGEVLREAGLDAGEIATLREEGTAAFAEG
jgi:alpha-methylacyl-CoA racemase